MNWPYKYFQESELECKCLSPECGGWPDSEAAHAFMRKLDAWREAIGYPITVVSGYRCSSHPQKSPNHVTGCAMDFSVEVKPAIWLPLALNYGFTGIGFRNDPGKSQKNHIDTAHSELAIWTYG